MMTEGGELAVILSENAGDAQPFTYTTTKFR